MEPAKIVLIVSGVLYLISLALPTVANYTGLTSLISGPFGLFLDTKWGIVWLANLFYFIAVFRQLISTTLPKLNWVLLLIAILIASGSFFIEKIIVNEGGSRAVAHLHSGFYVWIAAMAVLLAYAGWKWVGGSEF